MAFWGVLALLQKAYSLGFSARRPPRGKAAPSRRLAFAQIKPTKINQSLFGTKGNVRPEGMFNRAHLAPEAPRAYDTLLECVLNGQKGCEVSARAGMDTIKALV